MRKLESISSSDSDFPKAKMEKVGQSQNQQKDTKEKSKHSSLEQNKKEYEVLSKSSASSEQPEMQRNPLICYRCGEQGHYAKNCSSENVCAGYKDRKLNPKTTEFKPPVFI